MRVSILCAAMAVTVMAGLTTSAEARRYEGDAKSWQRSDDDDRPRASRARRSAFVHSPRRARIAAARREESRHAGVGGRPGAWCGWWMRTQRGGGPEYNVARNWANYGSSTSPQVGAVVVWPHHVGEIVGRADNGQWIVRSGNDGGAVRSRARSLAGAIAVRM